MVSATSPLPLAGVRALMFVGDDYEDLELLYPRLRLIEEGCEVVLAGLGEPGALSRGKHGYPIRSDANVRDVDPGGFHCLVIPGGFMPDRLRRDPRVLELTRAIHAAGRPVAHICHAGWIPISAGIVRGFRVTSTPGIKDDLVNAGAQWVDQEVVVDRNQITSRRPDDLPAFCRAIISALRARQASPR